MNDAGADEETLSPCQKIFRTVELLEHVLASVPATTLLCARRTDKLFREVIDDSPTLRTKLFFEKDPSIGEARWLLLEAEESIEDVRKAPVPEFRVTEYDVASKISRSEGIRVAMRYLLNPILFEPDEDYLTPDELNPTARMVAARLKLLTLPTDVCSITSEAATDFCWRMFLTQPPITSVSVMVHFGGCDSGRRMRQRIERLDGLRYGDVIRKIHDLAGGEGPTYMESAFIDGFGVNIIFPNEEEMAMVANGVWYAST